MSNPIVVRLTPALKRSARRVVPPQPVAGEMCVEMIDQSVYRPQLAEQRLMLIFTPNVTSMCPTSSIITMEVRTQFDQRRGEIKVTI